MPALAIDPVAGGAKVLKQARTVGWDAVVTADALKADLLEEKLAYCLSEPARRTAVRCGRTAAEALREVRRALIEGLTGG